MSEAGASRLNIADEFISRPAREHPQKLAILGEERRDMRQGGQATYAELECEVNRVAQGLRELGCRPGERVLIVLADSVEFIASFFGTAKIGAIAVPVNSMAREKDLQHYTEGEGAKKK